LSCLVCRGGRRAAGKEGSVVAIQEAPQLLDNPCCDFINEIPWYVFLGIHIALFLFGAYFASRSFGAGARGFGWGFTLFALGEISYMTYHVNITTFLFAHTIAEVLILLAFLTIFVAAARGESLTRRTSAPMGAA
jgi:hypothetical protein